MWTLPTVLHHKDEKHLIYVYDVEKTREIDMTATSHARVSLGFSLLTNGITGVNLRVEG